MRHNFNIFIVVWCENVIVYHQEHPLIKKSEVEEVDIAAWFIGVRRTMEMNRPSWQVL